MKRASQLVFIIIGLLLLGNVQAMADVAVEDHDTGPLQFGMIYSDQFGWIGTGKWTNYLTQNNAFAFQLDFGSREFRLGGTLGHQFTPDNRIKVTAEHLAQDFNFDYAAGSEYEWVGQTTFGANFQHLFSETGKIQGIDLGGYYSSAEDENFNTVAFSNAQGNFIDLQKAAGATSKGGELGVQLKPWARSLIRAALNYDAVDYNTQYVPADNSSGFGFSLSQSIILTPHLKLDLGAGHRVPFTKYQVGINWLAPVKPGNRLEVGFNVSHLNGDIFTDTDNRAMATIAYRWGGHSDTKAAYGTPTSHTSLSEWTSIPAVAMPAVLVQKDEGIE